MKVQYLRVLKDILNTASSQARKRKREHLVAFKTSLQSFVFGHLVWYAGNLILLLSRLVCDWQRSPLFDLAQQILRKVVCYKKSHNWWILALLKRTHVINDNDIKGCSCLESFYWRPGYHVRLLVCCKRLAFPGMVVTISLIQY